MTNEDIRSAIPAQVPANTKRSKHRAASMWQAWAIGRNAESTKEWVNPDLTSVTDADLAAWIPRFVLEIENKNGEPYPPNTLDGLVMGLQRQLHSAA